MAVKNLMLPGCNNRAYSPWHDTPNRPCKAACSQAWASGLLSAAIPPGSDPWGGFSPSGPRPTFVGSLWEVFLRVSTPVLCWGVTPVLRRVHASNGPGIFPAWCSAVVGFGSWMKRDKRTYITHVTPGLTPKSFPRVFALILITAGDSRFQVPYVLPTRILPSGVHQTENHRE